MACVECHRYAETHARATIPNIEVCVGCHSQEPLGDSVEESKVIDYVARGAKIPWTKIYRLPDHVFFSHRRHTAIARIDCATCHGKVEEMSGPIEKQNVPISMDRCMDCHEKHDVDNDCTRCHR